jgi:hypothetical protein
MEGWMGRTMLLLTGGLVEGWINGMGDDCVVL